MMEAYLQNFLDTSNYKSKVKQQDALFVYISLTLIFLLVTVYILFIPDTGGPDRTLTFLESALSGNLVSAVIVLFFYVFMPFIYFSTRRGNLFIGGVGLSLVWYVLTIVPVLLSSRNMVHPTTAVSLCVLIILSGLILRERGLVGGALIAFITLLLNFDPAQSGQVPVLVAQLLGTTIFVYMYIQYAAVSRIEGGQLATEERIKLADITIQISSLTLDRTTVEEVLKQGINLINESYPQFYHVQVFLLDESKRNAQLVASTGEAGRTLIQNQHSISVGSESVIGQTTLRNTHVISRSTDTGTVHKRNEFLPNTVLETAFPLRVGNQVIGALDLQSTNMLELQDSDIFTYQSLANNFALAIDNVRQFEASESRIRENQELAVQARQAIKEVDRLNKRLMEQAWSEYLLQQEDGVGLNVDFESNQTEENNMWSTSLTQAMEDGNMIQSTDNNQRVISIPLKVRGQVIGAMEFELGNDNNIDPNNLNLIQEVSERFGLAAENTRLVEQSQRIAQREALINEIGTRLQATNNIESTLTEAVRSLSNVLSANRVSIKLREPDTTV
jgi:GAF domain-containing protein